MLMLLTCCRLVAQEFPVLEVLRDTSLMSGQNKLSTLEAGQWVHIVATQGEWVKVKDPMTDHIAWVHRRDVRTLRLSNDHELNVKSAEKLLGDATPANGETLDAQTAKVAITNSNEALSILNRVLEKQTYLSAKAHLTLADAYVASKMPAKALQHADIALEIYDQIYGRESSSSSIALYTKWDAVSICDDVDVLIPVGREMIQTLKVRFSENSHSLTMPINYLKSLGDFNRFDVVKQEAPGVIRWVRRWMSRRNVSTEDTVLAKKCLVLALEHSAHANRSKAGPSESIVPTLEEAVQLSREVYGPEADRTKGLAQFLATARGAAASTPGPMIAVTAPAAVDSKPPPTDSLQKSLHRVFEVTLPETELKIGTDVVARIKVGTRLWQIVKNGDWLQTIDPASGKIGWLPFAAVQNVKFGKDDLKGLDLGSLAGEKIDQAIDSQSVTPELLQQSINVYFLFRDALGTDNPFVAKCLRRMGVVKLALRTDKPEEAVSDIRMSWSMLYQVHGPLAIDTLDQLLELAVSVEGVGNHEDAEEALRMVLGSTSNVPHLTPTLTICEQYLAKFLLRNKSPDAAIDFLTERLAGINPTETAIGTRESRLRELLSRMQISLGRFDDAEKAIRQQISRFEAAHGPRDENTLFAMAELANLYKKSGDYEPAIAVHKDALKILRTLDPEAATVLIDHTLGELGELSLKSGQLQPAEDWAIERLKHLEISLPADSRTRAEWVGKVIDLLLASKSSRTLEIAQQHVASTQQNFGPQSRPYASALSGIAAVYRDRNDSSRARVAMDDAISVSRILFGQPGATVDEKISFGIELSTLALSFGATGEFQRAIPLLKERLAVHQAAEGQYSAFASGAISEMAEFYQRMGNTSKAESILNEHLAALQEKFGSGHISTAEPLKALAGILKPSDPTEAERLYKQSLSVLEELTQGEQGRPDMAGSQPWLMRLRVLKNLIDLTIGRDRTTANEYITKFDSAFETMSGSDVFAQMSDILMMERRSVILATASRNFSDKAYETGIKKLEAAVAETKAAHNVDYRDTPALQTMLATFLIKAGREREALQLADEVQREQRTALMTVLPTMPEQQQLGYLRNSHVPTIANMLAIVPYAEHASLAADLSAGWVLNAKAILHEVLAEAERLRTPEVAPLVEELRIVRDRISRATYQQTASNLTSQATATLAKLKERESDLANRIAAGGSRGEGSDPWVSVAAVQEALPPKSAFINVKRVRQAGKLLNGQTKDPVAYIAWVMSASRGQIEMVNLGDADEIDALLQAARTSIQKGITTRRVVGDQVAEAAAQTELARLSRKIWHPLEAKLPGVERLFISPDSNLWLAPWSALLRTDGTYLVEGYNVSLLLSGRELADADTRDAEIVSDGTVIFANPAFGVGGRADSEEPSKRTSASGQLDSFRPLPGTAVEATAIKNALVNSAQTNVILRLGSDASEAWLKQMPPSRILVLSTHGFFLSAPATELSFTASLSRGAHESQGSPNTQFQNPLVHCGLALAGCNDRDQDELGNKEDGILTGLEIVGLDLRGTDLVVLSACETGVGEIRNGEGVAGLRQAFQLAGAKSVVSSLWNVEDGETARLMELLFKNLANGMNKSEALRQAQLTRIKARRDRYGAAHPFFWAAFTLTGRE